MTTWRWIDTMTSQLELCAAAPDDVVVLLCTDETDQALRHVVAMALERLRTDVVQVVLNTSRLLDGIDPFANPAVEAALAAASLVIDLGDTLATASTSVSEILGSARILGIALTAASDLDHLVAHPGLQRRLDRAEHLLSEADTCRLTTPEGTELTVDLDWAEVRTDRGIATEPGQHVRWPAGAVWLDLTSARLSGVVVLMPGDLIGGAGHLVRSPVRLEIDEGHLVEILGESSDADLVRSHLEAHEDEEAAYRVAEVGIGLNLTHRGGELPLFSEARLATGRGPLAAGRATITTGAAGGEPAIGFTMHEVSVIADEVQLVRAGVLEGALAPDVYERAAGS